MQTPVYFSFTKQIFKRADISKNLDHISKKKTKWKPQKDKQANCLAFLLFAIGLALSFMNCR